MKYITKEIDKYLNGWGKKEKFRYFHMSLDKPYEVISGKLKYKTYSNLKKYQPELFKSDRVLVLWKQLVHWLDLHPEFKRNKVFQNNFKNGYPTEEHFTINIGKNEKIHITRDDLTEIKIELSTLSRNQWGDTKWTTGCKTIHLVINPEFHYRYSDKIHLTQENVNAILCNNINDIIKTIDWFIQVYYPNKKWFKPLYGMKF